MALNPIAYTERTVADFLRYQLTAYPFSDERLLAQMKDLLSLEETHETPLLQGPYLSLSRSFRVGAPVEKLVADRLLHPHMRDLIPYPSLYGHQEQALRSIGQERPTLVSTGTGSGKTECFLYPVISRCLERRDSGDASGVVAVLVYPMNALAEDQLNRLRELLAGTGVTFGMYVGHTPDRTSDVGGQRLRPHSSKADYQKAVQKARDEGRTTAVHPPEERVSREQMRTPGEQPQILLTNVKQLELLLTRHRDVELFDAAPLEFLVFDEAHTFSGAAGAETACLIRRLRSYCGRDATETVCIGTSATLVDESGSDAAQTFASRFFGVDHDQVQVIQEEYEGEDWQQRRVTYPAPPGSPAEHLREVLEAIEVPGDDGAAISAALDHLAGETLQSGDWRETLYDVLAASEICYQVDRILHQPLALEDAAEQLTEVMGRPVSPEEILCWLGLGAASRRAGRPLLRPVVHAFVRGVGGAVVTFPEDHDGSRLWLSAEQESQQQGDGEYFQLPVTTCNTCGQHYFVHSVEDINVGDRGLGGGQAVETGRVWQALEEAHGGQRFVLTDRVLGIDDPDEEPNRTHEAFFCRYCGALHPTERTRCDACGRESDLVRLLAVQFSEKFPGYLVSCISCKAPGRPRGSRYHEPARPVRAAAVSDVHILAQSMLHHADRKRLLIFSDNRQDAAFQAGWMRDHARRFRLRALMGQQIDEKPASIGDLAVWLDEMMENDDALSRALLPEVWAIARKEAAGTEHSNYRRRFLRILVLREITTGLKQRFGLEPWGRLKIEYVGLTPDLPFVQSWAPRLNVELERLCEGIGAILDIHRRNMILLDRDEKIFSRYWQDGDWEVQRGFLPMLKGVPTGLKLERDSDDHTGRISQWLSARADTTVRQAVRSWGLDDKDELETFLRELWEVLTSKPLGLLAPVTLTGSKGRALPGCSGAHQVDADKVLLTSHRGRWVCSKCQRAQIRPTPGDHCIAWRCDGTLHFQDEDPQDYDIAALNAGLVMVRPEEHSAQVPSSHRERLERLFKDEKSDAVNTLVCTPTLEMGVDIGALDTVLLRNVPPLPANYWQRAGRAGRRHRLAVNITYARPVSHDQAYFANPLKLLRGRVEPPRFNLRNELMLAKHVRAAALTRLQQLRRPAGGLGEFDREEIGEALKTTFPGYVKGFLFDERGHLIPEAFKADALNTIVTKHEDDLAATVERTFREQWPLEDQQVVEPDKLKAIVLAMAAELERVIARIKTRLDFAMQQISRLNAQSDLKGTLDPDEDALRTRCDRLVKRLKGVESRQRREAEGYDDTWTYGMLAAEGYLPGYGLEIGSILGTAMSPKHLLNRGDLYLPRPPAVALREYVPGNLVYASGNKFTPRYFHHGTEGTELYSVDVQAGAVHREGSATAGAIARLGDTALEAIQVCDVDMAFVSQITDDEEFRFQMPVATYAYDRQQHKGGTFFRWGERDLKLIEALRLRLVNVGPAGLVEQGKLGYPVSTVSGQSRSPFSSEAELNHFNELEMERYGKPIRNIGFYADVTADCIILPDCEDRTEAYSLSESLRLGMRHVLEMETEDIQIQTLARVGSEAVDAVLYDPMPGGSGLLHQATAAWGEVVQAALELLQGCVGDCGSSCPDCLRSFRNAYYHKHLDRHKAIELMEQLGGELETVHPIPPALKVEDDTNGDGNGMPVNQAEQLLEHLLERAGITDGEWQKQIKLGHPLGSTTPDVFFSLDDDDGTGICVYLDGLSQHIHGNPKTREKDRRIREELRNRDHDVIEIAASDLYDRDVMGRHFQKIVRLIHGKKEALMFKEKQGWYQVPGDTDPTQSD